MSSAFEGKSWTPSVDAITRAMSSEDRLLSISYLHLEVERHLATLARDLIDPRSKEIKGFGESIKLLKAIGIPSWIIDWCTLLNKARNEVAHNLHYNDRKIDSLLEGMNRVFDNNPKLNINIEFVAEANGDIPQNEVKIRQRLVVQGVAVCRVLVGYSLHPDAEKLRKITQGDGWK